MAKGCSTYTASNPDRPGVTETFTSPRLANQWIDKQGTVKPVEHKVRRNLYGQRCLRCGQWVAPGQGELITGEEAERQGLRLPMHPGYTVVHVQCPPKQEAPSYGLTEADPRLNEAWARMQEERWGKR
jgi:hypothetical protein